jgi:hypothetical protein
MSTHPNVMLIARLSPNDLPRKTYLAILADAGLSADGDKLKIGEDEYHVLLMDGDYHDDFQVSAASGEIVLMDMVTYGYGDILAWDDLREQHNALAGWIEANQARYQIGTSQICVGANYW